jgi:hypothetical protein
VPPYHCWARFCLDFIIFKGCLVWLIHWKTFNRGLKTFNSKAKLNAVWGPLLNWKHSMTVENSMEREFNWTVCTTSHCQNKGFWPLGYLLLMFMKYSKWLHNPYLNLLIFTKIQSPFSNSKPFVSNGHLNISFSMFSFGSYLLNTKLNSLTWISNWQ